MATAKLSVTIGSISFAGEGEEKWLTAQFDKMMEVAPKLAKTADSLTESHNKNSGSKEAQHKPVNNLGTLVSFLKDKDAEKNQNKKFITTAVYLFLKENRNLKTSDITEALKASHQTRLGNASHCLAEAAKKGYVEKEKDGSFFVTQDGLSYLGIEV